VIVTPLLILTVVPGSIFKTVPTGTTKLLSRVTVPDQVMLESASRYILSASQGKAIKRQATARKVLFI
jgi:hypothetical protein